MLNVFRNWMTQRLPRRRKFTQAWNPESLECRVLLTPPVLLDPSGDATYLAVPAPDTPQQIASSATVVDAESNFAGGQLTARIATGTKRDALGIASGAMGITTEGNSIRFDGEQIGTFQFSNRQLSVTLNAEATATAVQNLLRSVTFLNTAKKPGTIDRTVQFQVTDGSGETSGILSKVVHVQSTFNSLYGGYLKGKLTGAEIGKVKLQKIRFDDGERPYVNILVDEGDFGTAMWLPGLQPSGLPLTPATLNGTAFMGEVTFEFRGVEVEMRFQGLFKLQGKGAQGRGTLTISDVATDGTLVTGRGKWKARIVTPVSPA